MIGLIAALALFDAGMGGGDPRSPGTPLDFRGARLGMTIGEFAKLPVLGGYIKCGEALTAADRELRIRVCTRPGDNPFPRRLTAWSSDYNFVPMADGEWHLFEIVIIADPSMESELLDAANAKYGSDQIGGPIKFSWVHRRQTLTIDTACGRLGDAVCVMFSDGDGMDAYDALRAKQARGSDKF